MQTQKVYEYLCDLIAYEEDNCCAPEPDTVFEIIHQTLPARCAGRVAAAFAFTSDAAEFERSWRDKIRRDLL